MTPSKEIFISVDIETSGPIPAEYSLLSIGACDVFHPENTFFCKVQPINNNFDPKALEVTGLSLQTLRKEGHPPKKAMEDFLKWLLTLTTTEQTPIFVGFNAPFDWSFINYYFHKFTKSNPFGFSALDIKALYMGATSCSWHDTRSSKIAKHLKPIQSGNHDALQDARYQAELFRLIWKNL